MVDRLLDAETGALFRETIAQLQSDVHDELHTDTLVVWRLARDTDWPDTTDPEARTRIGSDTGKLYEAGEGGPTSGENVIALASPYRVRTVTTLDVRDGDWLVINGARVFVVEVVKRESAIDRLMNVYLSEITGTVEVPT